MDSQSHFHLGDLHRMSYGKRWQILGEIKQQSLAEHSYNVAVISMYILSQIREQGFLKPLETESTAALVLYRGALMHDYEEIFTGDMPAGTKRALDSFDDGISSLPSTSSQFFETLHEKIGGMAAVGDKRLLKQFEFFFVDGSSITAGQILKCADYIDALGWLGSHRDKDSKLHTRVYEGLEKRLSDYINGTIVQDSARRAVMEARVAITVPSGKILADIL